MGKTNIFLSYCWDDEEIADTICDYFKDKDEIKIHRDKIEIKEWRDIKEYMNSINQMDFTIILVSQKYLESENCMYEVLEVMRDRKYKDKIFPAIIEHKIYRDVNRLEYIKYWEMKYNDFDRRLKEIDTKNISCSVKTLKLYQDIAANIDEFLTDIAYLNNPSISNVPEKILQQLEERNIINKHQKNTRNDNILEFVGISSDLKINAPSELEVNEFMIKSFEEVVFLLAEVCKKIEADNKGIVIRIDEIDKKSVTYMIYKNGSLVRGLKIYRKNIMGDNESIFLSDCTHYMVNDNSWNAQYSYKYEDGEMKLYALCSMWAMKKTMDSKEVVKDVWENYISPYLKR